MTITEFDHSHVGIALGQLGHITAVQHRLTSSDKPTCTYIGGLPYALPPTGPYRFRPPRALPPAYSYGTKANPGHFTGVTAQCPQSSFTGKLDKSIWDENCLQLNIWIPDGPSPSKAGWPIFFFIHGGWLQFGSANIPSDVIANMFHETPFKAIVVMPEYRLNAFGFLSSRELLAEARRNGETVGNNGFWDQRTALEWVAKNIHLLGGDASQITVGGHSAGSHSSFHQLAHDLDRPPGQQLISRVIMWSNGPGVQAKDLRESQEQFDELLTRLDIGHELDAESKLLRLRSISADKLVDVLAEMDISEFRAVSDGDFVNKHVSRDINSGAFAEKLKRRGIKILNGECSEEWNVYAQYRTPRSGYPGLRRRLIAEYPEHAVRALLPLFCPEKRLPEKYKDWKDVFGKIYADMQVYALERGFADRLHANGFTVGRDLLRYRLEWRARCVDNLFPPAMGVTHGTDVAIWFWGQGLGEGLSTEEKKICLPLMTMLNDFVRGAHVSWKADDARTLLRLSHEGKIDLCSDALYEQGVAVWNAATTYTTSQSEL